jgi:hypothetical protein
MHAGTRLKHVWQADLRQLFERRRQLDVEQDRIERQILDGDILEVGRRLSACMNERIALVYEKTPAGVNRVMRRMRSMGNSGADDGAEDAEEEEEEEEEEEKTGENV